ncbi:SRPBCC family protein [Nocardioides marmorisolisilvae]|uniref:SRPBCC family protein n=1 Tax=Nocardioides marmorisolisilvae TaxID=1542737 RepID=A0A3N0DUL7_9ACTN|nr:SRPBCC family protein [Nocardioides marmorisolisilvae]RNL79329.1 SRPBCC family protein [Nocardioides marmorisolisilvae]
MQGSVTVHMAAPPEVVWSLVSDVTRIGELSPETFEAVWLRGATGPELGAYFKGHVKRNGVGPVYWTKCQVEHCVVGEDFGFVVLVGDRPTNHWRYQLRATDGGTEVTESFRLETQAWSKAYWALLGWARGKTNERGMRQTLERIKEIVEAEAR